MFWLLNKHPFLFAVGGIPIDPGFLEEGEAGWLIAAAAVDRNLEDLVLEGDSAPGSCRVIRDRLIHLILSWSSNKYL